MFSLIVANHRATITRQGRGLSTPLKRDFEAHMYALQLLGELFSAYSRDILYQENIPLALPVFHNLFIVSAISKYSMKGTTRSHKADIREHEIKVRKIDISPVKCQ